MNRGGCRGLITMLLAISLVATNCPLAWGDDASERGRRKSSHDQPRPGRPAASRQAPMDRAPQRAAPPRRPAQGMPSGARAVRSQPPRPGRGPQPARYVRPGRPIRELPRDHHVVEVRGSRYYYHNGTFYHRHDRHGYVVVRPPLGARVGILPLGFAAVVLAGLTYYTFAGVYYQQTPSGYVVVEPPVGVVSAEPAPASGMVVVISRSLNARSGPGYNYPVIGVFGQGQVLEVRGVAGGWLYILLPDGQLGWVAQQYTAPAAPPPNG